MKFYHSLAFATALLAVGCTGNENVIEPETPIDNSLKEQISFSLSDNSAAQTRAGFGGSATFLAMRIQSNEKGSSNVKYTRTVATAAKDATSPTTETSFSEVTFSDANIRYWDDAHGRKSLLSVFAVAIPNSATDIMGLENKLAKGDASSAWGTSGTNTIEWTVTTTAQTKDATSENTAAISDGTIDKEDLVYSNNIQAGGSDGVYRWNGSAYDPAKTGDTTHHNGQMLFFQEGMSDTDAANKAITDAPGHFDKGHLKFNHALSRITVTLVAGEGFGSAPFAFADGTNIKLLGMNVKGTLNLVNGTWTVATSEGTGDINKMAKTTTGTTAAGTYTAQMLPDYKFVDGSNTNVMEFTIDNNTYFITQDMLFDALVYDANGNGNKDAGDGDLVGTTSPIKMEQGKNYNFKITINKTQIQNITATLAKWVDVTAADYSIDNRHVEFTFRDNATGTEECTQGINFYQKTEDLTKIYTDNTYIAEGKGFAFSGDYYTKGAATLTSDGGKLKTNWYYEDNRTAYHFRTISDNAKSTLTGTNPTTFTMTGANTMPDYHWGAPMKNGTDVKLAYDPDPTSKNGYKANVHPGLTSTASDVKITEMHMLSNLNITLETSTGSDKVKLDGATIKITNLANTATVDMGTGYITPGTIVDEVEMAKPTATDYWTTENVKTKAFKYAVIPQELKRTSGTNNMVGITITTSDNNQYYIIADLSEIIASTVTDDRNQSASSKIQRWFPGHNYYYNIKITKKGIDAITATVAKWVDVTAADIPVDLEK